MKRNLRRTALVLASLVCLGVMTLSAQNKVDVTGNWSFDVQTDAGPGSAQASLKQDGEKLSGHYSGSTLGEAEVTGTVKGTAIEFAFNANVQGNSIPVSYKGTVESATTMKGTISITGLGNGTFTGTKK